MTSNEIIYLLALPQEKLLEIIEFLPADQLVNLCRANKELNQRICKDEEELSMLLNHELFRSGNRKADCIRSFRIVEVTALGA